MPPPLTEVRVEDTCRLVPSIYPSVGILDTIAAPDDLPFVLELETWTNDRISTELGLLNRIPRPEWVTGKPMSSVIMAAFCHPRIGGGRFTGPQRGAWYAATKLDTAHAEVIYHRTRELEEVGVSETRVEMRLYRSDFHAAFHDVRAPLPENDPLHDSASYAASQVFGQRLFEAGSNGVLYRSVRRPGGECLGCFRPSLVNNVRTGGHYEYRWEGTRRPRIRKL